MTTGRTDQPAADTWRPWNDDTLMECMSIGASFAQAGRQLGVTKSQARSRFNRLAKRMGAQAA